MLRERMMVIKRVKDTDISNTLNVSVLFALNTVISFISSFIVLCWLFYGYDVVLHQSRG